MSGVQVSKKTIDQQQISGTQTSILNENVQDNQLDLKESEKISSNSKVQKDNPHQSEQLIVQSAKGQSAQKLVSQPKIEDLNNFKQINDQSQEQVTKKEGKEEEDAEKEIISSKQINNNNPKEISQKSINLIQKQMELQDDSQSNSISQRKGQEQSDLNIISPNNLGSSSNKNIENLQPSDENTGVENRDNQRDDTNGSQLEDENNQNIDNNIEKQQQQLSNEDNKADSKNIITPIKVGTQIVRRVVHIPKLQQVSRDTKQYPPHQQKSQKQDSNEQKKGSYTQLYDKQTLEKESSYSTEKQTSPRREKQNNNIGIYSHLSGISPRRDDKFKNANLNNSSIGSTSEQVMKMELDNAYKLIEVIKKDNKQLQSRAYDISQYEKMNSMESELRTKDAEIKNLKREMEIIKRAQRVGPGEEEKRQLQIKRTEDYTERYALKQKIKELQEKIVEQDDKFTKQLQYLRQQSSSVDKSGNSYQLDSLQSPGKQRGARRQLNGSLSLQPAISTRSQQEENINQDGQSKERQQQTIQSNYQTVESYSLERNLVRRKIPASERSLSPQKFSNKFNNLQVIKDQQQQQQGYGQQLTLAQQQSNDTEFNNLEFNEVNFYDVIQRAKVYKKSRDSFSKKLNLEVSALKSQITTLKQETIELKQQLVVKDRKISSLQSQFNLLQRQKIQQQNNSISKLLGSDRKISTEITPEQIQQQFQQQVRNNTEGVEIGNDLYDVQITPVKQRQQSDLQQQSQGKLSSASESQLKNRSARSINSVESMKNLAGINGGEDNQEKQVYQQDSITPKAIFPEILSQESKKTSERKQSLVSDRKQSENSSRKISLVSEKRYSQTIEADNQSRKQSILGQDNKQEIIRKEEGLLQEQEQLKSSAEIQKSSSRHSQVRASIGRKSISGSSQKSALSSSAFSEMKATLNNNGSVEKKNVFDESNTREVQVGVNEPKDQCFSDKSLITEPSVIVAVRIEFNQKGISGIQCDYRTITAGKIINAPLHVSAENGSNKKEQEYDETAGGGEVSLNFSVTQNQDNQNDQEVEQNDKSNIEKIQDSKDKNNNNNLLFDVSTSSEDYLKYIQGTIDCETNSILQLSLISALGSRSNLGIKDLQPARSVSSVQHFLMDIKEDEVPRCLYGAITSDGRLTQLGFVVEKLTIEEKIERSSSSQQNYQRQGQNEDNISTGQIGKNQSIEQNRQSSSQSQKKESQKEISVQKSKNDMLSESAGNSRESKQKSSTSIRSQEQDKTNESEKKKKSVMNIQLNLDNIQIPSDAAVTGASAVVAGGAVEQKSSEGKILSGGAISDQKIGIDAKDKQ